VRGDFYQKLFKILQKAYGDDCNILNEFVNEISFVMQNFKQILCSIKIAAHKNLH